MHKNGFQVYNSSWILNGCNSAKNICWEWPLNHRSINSFGINIQKPLIRFPILAAVGHCSQQYGYQWKAYIKMDSKFSGIQILNSTNFVWTWYQISTLISNVIYSNVINSVLLYVGVWILLAYIFFCGTLICQKVVQFLSLSYVQ